MQVREASALGLLEGPLDADGNRPDSSLPRRAQSLSRFLLEQLAKEEASVLPPASPGAAPPAGVAGVPAVERIFGCAIRQTTTCTHCSDATTRLTRSMQVELAYPAAPPAPGAARPRFCELLARSLRQSGQVRSWCANDKAYHRMLQSREVASLPTALMVGCAGSNDGSDHLAWWGVPESATVAASACTKGKADRSESESEAAASVAAATAPVDEHWLPLAVRVTLAPDGSVSCEEAPEAALLQHSVTQPPPGSEVAFYQLCAVVSHVRDMAGRERGSSGRSRSNLSRVEEGHLVAHVRVVPPYVEARGAFFPPTGPTVGTPGVSPLVTSRPGVPPPLPPTTPPRARPPPGEAPAPSGTPVTPHPPPPTFDSDWVLFNDFSVTPTPPSEVSQLYGAAKVPCLLLFSRINAPPLPPPRPVDVNDAVYTRFTLATWPPPAGADTFLPLDLKSERPHRGSLFGLDAEFVALAPAEKELRADGTELMLRPARLGLARVSVVRADGPLRYAPCIDDYVRASEPVHDYLTRFSGVVHGDLDPSLSRHHITTLKAAYLKLRYLVDAGACFVGHGLRKDFRMINIVVPKDQIVDTVELFHFKRQRKLSLRFLASQLLGEDIQGVMHDSIEDARVACALYTKYRELQAAGTFQETLLELYRHGKAHGWEGGGSGGNGASRTSAQPPRLPAAPLAPAGYARGYLPGALLPGRQGPGAVRAAAGGRPQPPLPPLPPGRRGKSG